MRFQDEHFVGLDDAVQALRQVMPGPAEEAVALSELQRVAQHVRVHRGQSGPFRGPGDQVVHGLAGQGLAAATPALKALLGQILSGRA